MTIDCLRYVFEMTGVPFDVVVWDNGSRDGTISAVREQFPSVTSHYCPENLGVASGRNAAAKLAIHAHSPDYLLFLDNDIEVDADFLSALLKPMLRDEKVGQTQAKLRFYDDRRRLNDGGGCRISFWRGTTIPVGFNAIDEGQYDTARDCVACGGAMLTRRETFEALGGFDEIFSPVGPEDLDYSLRLQNAGYRAIFVPDALGYHRVSHTFGGGRYSEEYARHKARNWFVFLRRHGPLWHQLAFFLFSAPILVGRVVVREVSRGNVGAVRGMFRGLLAMTGRS
jgi:GT2 family glycosyltransferase